jgi:hypothetical protein
LTDFNPLITPDATVIYASRIKLFLLTCGSAAFMALGVWFWNQGGIEPALIAVLTTSSSGVCLVFGISGLIQRKPALILNHEGLYDGSSALGGIVLHWQDVEGMYISSVRRQRFLSITVRNPDELLQQAGLLKAFLMRSNIALVGAPVNISAISFSMTFEELIQLFKKHCPAVSVS